MVLAVLGRLCGLGTAFVFRCVGSPGLAFSRLGNDLVGGAASSSRFGGAGAANRRIFLRLDDEVARDDSKGGENQEED